MKEFPEEDAYTVPEEFSSDWLNEYYTDYEQSSDDYRFVYMGPKGSWLVLVKERLFCRHGDLYWELYII